MLSSLFEIVRKPADPQSIYSMASPQKMPLKQGPLEGGPFAFDPKIEVNATLKPTIT
jgi:hypothetical protein